MLISNIELGTQVFNVAVLLGLESFMNYQRHPGLRVGVDANEDANLAKLLLHLLINLYE